MVTVLVEHYLNDEGKRYFSNWIDEVELVLKEISGFRSIRQVYKAGEESKSFLILEFEDYELLKLWSGSKKHELLINRLKPYMVEKQRSSIFIDYFI